MMRWSFMGVVYHIAGLRAFDASPLRLYNDGELTHCSLITHC